MLSDRDYMRPGDGRWRPWERRQTSVIKPLIWINVVFFVLTGFGSSENGLLELILLHPAYLRQFQVWRLGTYMFAHGSLMHILFNMWGLFLFGRPVEQLLGPHRFLRLYFIGGLVGGLAWLLANWWTTSFVQLGGAVDPTVFTEQLQVLEAKGFWVGYSAGALTVKGPAGALGAQGLPILRAFGGCIGASGAVFGVMLAAAMTFPDMQVILLIPPVPMRLRTLVVLYTGLEVVLALGDARGITSSRVARLAHLGGLVGAFIYMKQLGHPGPGAALARWWRDLRHRRRYRHFRRVADPRPGTGGLAADVDRVLDKIGREGIGSLTPEERDILERTRENLKNRPGR